MRRPDMPAPETAAGPAHPPAARTRPDAAGATAPAPRAAAEGAAPTRSAPPGTLQRLVPEGVRTLYG